MIQKEASTVVDEFVQRGRVRANDELLDRIRCIRILEAQVIEMSVHYAECVATGQTNGLFELNTKIEKLTRILSTKLL